MRGVGGGNGLAETDDGERLILERCEVCQSLGGVICHISVFMPDNDKNERGWFCLLHEFPRST